MTNFRINLINSYSYFHLFFAFKVSNWHQMEIIKGDFVGEITTYLGFVYDLGTRRSFVLTS